MNAFPLQPTDLPTELKVELQRLHTRITQQETNLKRLSEHTNVLIVAIQAILTSLPEDIKIDKDLVAQKIESMPLAGRDELFRHRAKSSALALLEMREPAGLITPAG